MLTAPRTHWMFKTYGVKDVFILDGTFSKWQSEGLPIESGESESAFRVQRDNTSGDFNFALVKDLHFTFEEVIENEKTKKFTLVDARPEASLKDGAIEGSLCVPFPSLLNEDKTFKSTEEL